MNIAGNSALTTNLGRIVASLGQGNAVPTTRPTSTPAAGFKVDGTAATGATPSSESNSIADSVVADSIQASNDYRQLAADLRAGKITAAEKEEMKLRQDMAATSPAGGSFNAAVAAFTSNSGDAGGSSLSVTV